MPWDVLVLTLNADPQCHALLGGTGAVEAYLRAGGAVQGGSLTVPSTLGCALGGNTAKPPALTSHFSCTAT